MQANGGNKRHSMYGDGDVPYTQLRFVGRGAYGVVDIVKRTSTSLDGELYARKVFMSDKGLKEWEISAIMREASIGARLRHRHIVRFVETYETQNLYAILMTPVAEGNLKQYFSTILEGGHEERQLQLPRWFGCLANGLDYLHRESIHHRDIKPQNILTIGDNILYTDFGISRDFEEMTLSGATDTFGTTMYRSPEHGDGYRPGRRADVFSLGAVFLEMAIVAIIPQQFYRFVEDRNGQYAENMNKILEWIDMLRPKAVDFPWLSAILFLCENMLQLDQRQRPYALSLWRCWSYQPCSGVPSTPIACKCCQQLSNEWESSVSRNFDEALRHATQQNDTLVENLLLKMQSLGSSIGPTSNGMALLNPSTIEVNREAGLLARNGQFRTQLNTEIRTAQFTRLETESQDDVIQQNSASHLRFNDLTNAPNHLADPKSDAYWGHLTTEALSVYRDIYNACKDEKGKVSFAKLRQQLPRSELYSEMLAAMWHRMKITEVAPLRKNSVLAVLYMMHVETYLDQTPKDDLMNVGIAKARFKSLKRFDDWVDCACDLTCGRKWNFANDLGLVESADSREDCKVFEWIERGRPRSPHEDQGLQQFELTVERWKNLRTRGSSSIQQE